MIVLYISSFLVCYTVHQVLGRHDLLLYLGVDAERGGANLLACAWTRDLSVFVVSRAEGDDS